jgi:hypothetical protein
VKNSPEATVEVGGLKSATPHLHLMEALTELYSEPHDPEVRRSPKEFHGAGQRRLFWPPESFALA